ncbi:MAG: hypothetical protein AAF560_03690 [Acidobacteriota bacterium]
MPEVEKIANQEFWELDNLHPLSGLIQAVRSDSKVPFITRAWDFSVEQTNLADRDPAAPGALIKQAQMLLPDLGQTITGACICYEPPTSQLLADNPNNFFIFRTVVGHEIGHYWWDHLRPEGLPSELRQIKEADPREAHAMVEQVVSLFSIFAIMYRGYWARRKLDADQIGEAWSKLRFESRAAARLEGSILKRLAQSELLPVFEPELPTELNWNDSLPEHTLSSDSVTAIRHAARSLVAKASRIPFASAASIIGQRKLEHFVTFAEVDDDEYPGWTAVDRYAEHEGSDVMSLWKEVTLSVPDPGDDPLPLGHRLQVARHLAHVRLHSDWAGKPTDLREAEDTRSACSAESRDLARVLALQLHVMHGETQRRGLDLELAQLLLNIDPAGLQYLAEYAPTDFQWCCEDKDCPEADSRFLAEIREVGFDEAHCTFWGEDGNEFRISLPIQKFHDAGFQPDEIATGMDLKIFGTRQDGERNVTLVPMRPEV